MKHLKELNFRQNKIKTITITNVIFPQLTKLYLSNNQLKNLDFLPANTNVIFP